MCTYRAGGPIGDLSMQAIAKVKVVLRYVAPISACGGCYQSSTSSRRHSGVLVMKTEYTMFYKPGLRMISDRDSRQ